MRKRLIYISATLLLAVLVALVVWQSSFSFGEFGPSSPEQTYTVWAVSTLIFILTVTLGFMLVRNFVKLYVDHRRNREGSRIRTKLVLGALALTFTPVVFLVFFSIGVLNINLRRWFTQPAENVRLNFIEIGAAIERENQSKAEALAMWIAQSPEVAQARQNMRVDLRKTCERRGIAELRLEPVNGAVIWLCGPAPPEKQSRVEVRYGDLVLRTAPVLDLSQIQSEITEAVRRYHQLASEGQAIKRSYLQLLVLITLFILFFATWLALFLAKQISVPITALLGAAQEIRKGNLGTKVEVGAVDELASTRSRLQRDVARPGGEQSRAREPPAFHGSDSREHSDRSNFAGLRWPGAACKSCTEGIAWCRYGKPGKPAGRSLHAGRRRRDSIPDEPGTPYERGCEPA